VALDVKSPSLVYNGELGLEEQQTPFAKFGAREILQGPQLPPHLQMFRLEIQHQSTTFTTH